MWPASPSTTAPTESFSKFRAKPKVPSPKSNSSPYIASSKPKICTMPSAVVRTSPTFASVAAPLYPSIFFLMMLDISEGLILVVIFSPLIC